MAANEIHISDISCRFLITIKDGDTIVDLSSATLLRIIFHKPDATVATKTATLYTDGTDGIIYYNTITGDLDQAGVWKFQAYIEFGSGGKFHSDIGRFTVFSNLDT